jgi:hypothetical protein
VSVDVVRKDSDPIVRKDPIHLLRWLGKAATGELSLAIVGAFVIAKLLAGDAGLAAEPKPALILYPVFVMFLLVMGVVARMGFVRIGGVLHGSIDVEFYRTFDRGEEPPASRVVTRHFLNLFEMPIFFYVGVVIAFVTQQVTCWLVGVAWMYVALRLLHSYVHLTSNEVATRLSAWASSNVMLAVFWLSLFVGLVGT